MTPRGLRGSTELRKPPTGTLLGDPQASLSQDGFAMDLCGRF